MKILHIISSNGIYDAESVLLSFLENMKKDGRHEVQLVYLRSRRKKEPDIYFEAQNRGISTEVLYCRSKLDNAVIENLAQKIEADKISLVHTHGYKSNFYGLRAARTAGVLVVASLHGWTGENLKVKIYDVLDRRTIQKMDFAICVSPKIREEALNNKMPEEKVAFIPNGVDIEKFDEKHAKGSLRGELGLQGPVVIGCVGRLSVEKGHKFLLEAFKDIHQAYHDTKLLIVGEGDLKKELEEEAEKMGIKEAVIFTGEREDMPEVYNCMDIFVLPSLTEGIPVALLEAMSMKLPVVATSVGGVPFVLEGDVGKMVGKENPRELAEAISYFIEKKELCQQYGERARKRVEERFSVGEMVQRYSEVYEKILRGTNEYSSHRQ